MLLPVCLLYRSRPASVTHLSEHTCSPSPAAQLLLLAQQMLSRYSLTQPQLVQLGSVYNIRSEHIGEHETPRSFYSFSTGAQTPQSSLFSALQDSSALLHLPGGGDQMKLRPSTKLPTTWSNKVYLLRPRLLTNRPSEWRPAGGFFHWGLFPGYCCFTVEASVSFLFVQSRYRYRRYRSMQLCLSQC